MVEFAISVPQLVDDGTTLGATAGRRVPLAVPSRRAVAGLGQEASNEFRGALARVDH